MGRLIDADEYEKRIKPYDTEDVMDKALYNFAHAKLLSTPTARPKGKWTTRRTEYHDGEWWCTNCGQRCLETVMGKPRWKYCPYCGAEMEVE